MNTLLSVTLCAEELFNQEGARARLTPQEESPFTITPLVLNGGARLTVVTPERWEELANSLVQEIAIMQQTFITLWGEIPPLSVSLKLMQRERFLQLTGAPQWTNALFYRGEILIPLTENEEVDSEDLRRSVRHEYTHAVIHALSGGWCPGWLDEGLAQWAEGPENPILIKILADWGTKRGVIPLWQLQGGFTKLDTSLVAPAYAQSLYAAKLLVRAYGYMAIRRYLAMLKTTRGEAQSFRATFGVDEIGFERAVAFSLRKWREQKREADTKLFFTHKPKGKG